MIIGAQHLKVFIYERVNVPGLRNQTSLNWFAFPLYIVSVAKSD